MKEILVLVLTLVFIANSKISAQEITMFPGFWNMKYYQDDESISKQQVEQLMLNDAEANQLWQKSRKHMTIGYIAIAGEIGFLVWQLNRAGNSESQIGPLIGVLATGGVAIGFSLSANNLRKKSILSYNKNLKSTSFNFGPTYNGLGVVMKF